MKIKYAIKKGDLLENRIIEADQILFNTNHEFKNMFKLECIKHGGLFSRKTTLQLNQDVVYVEIDSVVFLNSLPWKSKAD